MEYVEILRSRRILTWWSAFIAAGLVLWVVSIAGHNIQTKGHVADLPGFIVVAVVSFGAFILASIVSPGLNNEAATIAITWTRPMARARIAWRYVAVDLVTIVLGAAILAVAVLAELAFAHLLVYIHGEPGLVLDVVLAVGCVVMWYALCLLAAARAPERAGMIAGLSWAVFLVLGILTALPVPPLIHGLIVGLNYFNPLAYFSGSDHGTMLAGGSGMKAAVVWFITIAALIGAVRLWSTREA